LRPLVPAALELDEITGTAWVGVIPFHMSGIARRPFPPIPGTSTFPELNVRTYVRLGDRAGVWFFSLDAGNRLAVWVARRFFSLPYFYADMRTRRVGRGVEYGSRRPSGPSFGAYYEPTGTPTPSPPGSLTHWLTERYCLYSGRPDGQLCCADIHHAPWSLQPATIELRQNEMLSALGLPPSGPPAQIHFAERLEVVVWPLRALESTHAAA
jgi:uncharacterized protein YqjF (DUF2071 family)